MGIEVRPATDFDDVATMLGPKRSDANVCWCLSYRLTSSRENRELVGPARGEHVRRLVQETPAPGVLAYDGAEVVGWAAVHPRADTSFARNRKIPFVDDIDVWSVWCIRVRPGHRGRGIAHHLLPGAVELARGFGAPAIEGYPVDNKGAKVDLTMAYVGTRSLFERAGFRQVAETDSVLNGFPRVVMRLDLRKDVEPEAVGNTASSAGEG
jgi:GNAT superfamily N-acetyltransferase